MNERRTIRPLARWFIVGAGLVVGLTVVGLIAIFALTPAEISWRARVPIAAALYLPDDSLSLQVGTCGAEPELDEFEEHDDEVRVAVVSRRTIGGSGGGDCLDSVTVQLQEPLGDRRLLDVTTGKELSVGR